MQTLLAVAVGCTLGLLAVGCSRKPFDGPTVDSFTGRIVRDGKPMTLPADKVVGMKLIFEERGRQFNIPLEPDGTFKIGWMPIGKYTVMMVSSRKGVKGGPSMYSVPGGMTIEAGKTQYTIDVGKTWEP
jgi:hypothetical protein